MKDQKRHCPRIRTNVLMTPSASRERPMIIIRALNVTLNSFLFNLTSTFTLSFLYTFTAKSVTVWSLFVVICDYLIVFPDSCIVLNNFSIYFPRHCLFYGMYTFEFGMQQPIFFFFPFRYILNMGQGAWLQLIVNKQMMNWMLFFLAGKYRVLHLLYCENPITQLPRGSIWHDRTSWPS